MRQALDIVAVSNGSRPPVSLRRRVRRQQDNNEETLHVQVQLLRAARRAPAQTELLTDRAMFTEAYAVIPKGVMRDIVTSHLPFWDNMRMWVIARPLSGFAETFSQYIVELAPNGGSDKPEQDPNAEAVLFVVEGELSLTLQGQVHAMQPGGYAFIPPGAD